MLEDHDTLASAQDSSDAVRRLYQAHKARHPKLSLAVMCRKLGLSSKGYLSDVMHGRRRLGSRYADRTIDAFQLAPDEAAFFRLLVAHDQEDDPAKQQALAERIASVRKTLSVERRRMPTRMSERFFPYEVFASFSLFTNRPTLGDLLRYFGPARRLEVERALEILAAEGLVEPEERTPEPRYRLVSDKVIFEGEDAVEARRKFLALALRDAETRLARWLKEPELAHFHATVISVKLEAYKKVLPKIKELLRQCEADLEDGEADMLVRFSAQIHPLK